MTMSTFIILIRVGTIQNVLKKSQKSNVRRTKNE
jgi:hypothetical protein